VTFIMQMASFCLIRPMKQCKDDHSCKRGRKFGLHMNDDKCKIMISNDWVDNM